MPSIKPRSEYHYWKATQPKPKVDKRMITEDQWFLFMDWVGKRYACYQGLWYSILTDDNKGYKPSELWEAYNRFLGAKPANPNTAP